MLSAATTLCRQSLNGDDITWGDKRKTSPVPVSVFRPHDVNSKCYLDGRNTWKLNLLLKNLWFSFAIPRIIALSKCRIIHCQICRNMNHFQTVCYSRSLGETFIHKAGLSRAQHISPFTAVCSFWLSLLFSFLTPLLVTI